jgi:hypothetical protein
MHVLLRELAGLRDYVRHLAELHHGGGGLTSSWARLTNIRPAAYLIDDGVQAKNLAERFRKSVKVRGFEVNEEGVRDVLLRTSPSHFGSKGGSAVVEIIT